MKIILHTSITISDSSRAILYDEASELALKGHDVTVLYCDGLMNMCWKNMDRDKEICMSCIFKQNYLDQMRISSKVKFISLKEFWFKRKNNRELKYHYDYSTVEDIKKLEYKNVNIGLASLSSYLTISRNLNPEIDQSFKEYFDVLLSNCSLLTDVFSLILEDLKPDLVYAYNGRMIDSRPIWEIARNNNIPFRVLEAQYTFSKIKKMYFNQASCFSVPELTNYIKNTWASSNLSDQVKEIIGSDFFNRRRNSLYAGDKIYTVNQELGVLPSSWNSSKKNITIFISSEDEFAAVGDEFDQFALFPNQLEGISNILNEFRNHKNTHFYIRIHPNLSKINYSYHTRIYELASYEGVTIVEPDSPISSYALVDNSDIVVVFGSTIGVEATFWDKPVILLAGAAYYNLEVCYIPKTKEELYGLLDSDLDPKNKLGAYMYGFLYNDEIGQDCMYVDCNVTTNFTFSWGSYRKQFMFNNWNKIFGSTYLYYFFMLSVKFIFRLKLLITGNPKLIIPTREKRYMGS